MKVYEVRGEDFNSVEDLPNLFMTMKLAKQAKAELEEESSELFSIYPIEVTEE